jgi:uncharacterized membrane protein
MQRTWISPDWLFPAFACFACAFGLSFIQWWFFNTMVDAASAMQSFHAILQHGLAAKNSMESVPVFGVHLWFLPLVVLPFFALFPAYPTLAAVQAIVLALSVPAAFRLAISTGLSSRNARHWTWFWALHPLVIGPSCGLAEGYQPLIFAVTPLLWSLVFARESKWGRFGLCLILALACREDISLTTLGIGIWVFWALGHRRVGTAVIVLSLGWGVLSTFAILPHLVEGTWNVWAKAFPPSPGTGTAVGTLEQGLGNFFQVATFGYLAFVYVAWGGFTKKSASLLVATIPLCLVLFLVRSWATRSPFLHYAATLAPIFFLAALLESGPGGVLGKRRKLGWLFAAVCLAVWQGRLLYHGIDGADRKSLVCLEAKIPRDSSLALYSPRGASRFAWGQDLTWMDPTHPPAEFTLIETGRKTPGWWTSEELAGMEDQLAKAGAAVVYQTPKVRLWALRDHKMIECP